MPMSVIRKKIFWKSVVPVIMGNMGRKVPFEVTHQINFACNLRCKYCGLPEIKTKELNTLQVKDAMEEFANAGTSVWNFTGGEPLLRTDLGELVRFSKHVGIDAVNINTNGMLYKYRKDGLNLADKILVSIDGPKEIHEEMRGYGSYDKVVEAINLIKADGVEISLISVLSEANMRNNFEGLKFMFDFAREKDVRISFNVIYTHDFNKHFIDKYKTGVEQTIEALKMILEFDKNTGLLDRTSSLYEETIKKLKGEETKIKSFAGILYCRLMPNGLVVPCIFNCNEGVDGLKHGFLNAFRMLSNNHVCNSTFSYHNDQDLRYMIDMKSVMKVLAK
jgi:MoaA/NifB/PqqE/SkfB family radical SAM enzyme